MQVIWGGESDLTPWISESIGLPRHIENGRTAAVVAPDGTLAAAVAFHGWDPEAGVIEVSAAARDARWATRSVLAELFGYAFRHNQAVAARIDETNTRARRLWRAFGAQEYIIPRLRGRTASAAIMVLTDDAWAKSKFMRRTHGQAETADAA